MRNEDLFKTLAEACHGTDRFNYMVKTCCEQADQARIREAKELQEDGFINFEKCGMDFYDDLKEVVKLEGTFTPIGMKTYAEIKG